MGIERIQGNLPVEWKPGHPQDPNTRPGAQAAEETDHVQFSERTQEVMRVKKLADAVPEIRLDRVDRLRREIVQGTYKVSGEEIADAIVQERQIDLTAL